MIIQEQAGESSLSRRLNNKHILGALNIIIIILHGLSYDYIFLQHDVYTIYMTTTCWCHCSRHLNATGKLGRSQIVNCSVNLSALCISFERT